MLLPGSGMGWSCRLKFGLVDAHNAGKVCGTPITMKTDPLVLLTASLLYALTGISLGQPAPIVPLVITGPSDLLRPAALAAPAGAATKDGVMKNLRKELPGTKWKAVAGAQLKGGLVASMSFTEKTVEP